MDSLEDHVKASSVPFLEKAEMNLPLPVWVYARDNKTLYDAP